MRQSLVSGSNRHATHPVNAMLNYAYGVLESQVRIATVAAGLDAALGHLHACHPGRVALVYDLMEPLRPLVDRLLVAFIQKTTFTYGDFLHANDGACRLHPQLARYVVATCRLLDSTVMDAARLLCGHMLQAGSGVTPERDSYNQP